METLKLSRFNTASGKYCCNVVVEVEEGDEYNVSIPQAVSTVATQNVLHYALTML